MKKEAEAPITSKDGANAMPLSCMLCLCPNADCEVSEPSGPMPAGEGDEVESESEIPSDNVGIE